jgi:hypothetical protein
MLYIYFLKKMSKFNKDILFLLFEELIDDSKTLFSCLMVNKLWCETIVPILWRNPWCYRGINYSGKNYLLVIFSFYLTDDIKEFLTRQGIQLPSSIYQSLSFDYLSFCKSMNINVINEIIYFAAYRNQFLFFLLQQEIYNVFIRKCSEIKYLDMKSIKHQLHYFPEAKTRLSSLCELKCDKSIESSYFYGLSCICRNIERLIIINVDTKYNSGMVKLIEVQKNLKYFEWEDDFDDSYFKENPYKEIFMALMKKEDTLNHLIVNFKFVDFGYYYHYTFLHKVLLKLRKLKTLKFYPSNFNGYNLEEKLKLLVCYDLEIFKIDDLYHKTINCIVENSGGFLKEILIRYNYYNAYKSYNEDSLTLIRTIRKKCPLIEHLSLDFPFTKDHLIELEKLLEVCQNLRVLLLSILLYSNDIKKLQEQIWENGENILEIIIRSSPTNLRELRFVGGMQFSLKSLEKFLENWKGHPISIISRDPIYSEYDYTKLIDKYKNNGVIKEFICDISYDVYLRT